MVPQTAEVVVTDAQAAHNEATRLASSNGDQPNSIIESIEFIGDVQTEPLPFE